MKKYLGSKIFITIGVLITFAVNMLAILLPLNGISTAAVSDSFKVYFVPANYVFSIWSVIYVALIAFTVYQLVLKDKEYKVVNKLMPWILLGNAANSIWLITWHYQIFNWGLALMLLLLLSLIVVYVTIHNAKQADLPKNSGLLIKLPFSIYLGWISVATVANVTNVLWLNGWDGFGLTGPMWAAIMIIVACILAITLLLKNKDYAYAAVIIWAVIGISQKFPNENQITLAVALGVFAIVLIAIRSFLKKK